MSASGSGYDLSVTTFSPDGRVVQVEYAEKAVEKSGTSIGIKCKDGVVMGVEKEIASKMLTPGANKRIFPCDLHSGMAISGMLPDGHALVNKAREEAREYIMFYGHHIPGRTLAERMAQHMHSYTLYWQNRPYGCAALLATYDKEDGPGLYCLRPSGVMFKYYACAIGNHKQGAQTELEKIKFAEITCVQAVQEIANIIYKLHDDVKDKEFELELSWMCEASEWKQVFVPKAVRDAAVKAAQESKQKSLMEDSDDEDD